ncbi:M56 family metallopeptidase [Paenibacillus sp. y28]|uniref:M56 family metallopeptidase n=1 Tax=Paenibacillus sp. y28 TaxID=3129110 RepID=UPI003018CDC3
MWQKRSKTVFIASVAVVGILLLQMGLYALHVLFGTSLGVNLFQFCHSLLQMWGLWPLGLLLNGLIVYTMAMLLAGMVRQALASGRTWRKLNSSRDEELTRRLNKRYGRDGGVLVIGHDEPLALTMGLLQPKIVVSSGLVRLLDEGELAAVLYHEQFHQRYRDPLKTFLLSLAAAVIWYVPVLKWLHLQYKIAREILADSYAMQELGSEAELGGALLKLLKRGTPRQMPFAYASFADTSINYRIHRILDPQAEPGAMKLPIGPLVVSAHVVAALSVLFVMALL